jgi:hypothetical protein
MRLLQLNRLRGLLPIRGIKRSQITGDALLQLRPSLLDLGLGEILVAIVHRFELRPVNGDAGFQQRTIFALQCGWSADCHRSGRGRFTTPPLPHHRTVPGVFASSSWCARVVKPRRCP